MPYGPCLDKIRTKGMILAPSVREASSFPVCASRSAREVPPIRRPY